FSDKNFLVRDCVDVRKRLHPNCLLSVDNFVKLEMLGEINIEPSNNLERSIYIILSKILLIWIPRKYT
ncbi:hypothetical protein COY95_03930, partial [Candidatus Woesearchaeota archaeon CG_4_10_14_0_8_um_filter_47_5]